MSTLPNHEILCYPDKNKTTMYNFHVCTHSFLTMSYMDTKQTARIKATAGEISKYDQNMSF